MKSKTSSRPVKVGSLNKMKAKAKKITTGKSVKGSTGSLNRKTNAKYERSKITRA
jgi:hypothetical protein